MSTKEEMEKQITYLKEKNEELVLQYESLSSKIDHLNEYFIGHKKLEDEKKMAPPGSIVATLQWSPSKKYLDNANRAIKKFKELESERLKIYIENQRLIKELRAVKGTVNEMKLIESKTKESHKDNIQQLQKTILDLKLKEIDLNKRENKLMEHKKELADTVKQIQKRFREVKLKEDRIKGMEIKIVRLGLVNANLVDVNKKLRISAEKVKRTVKTLKYKNANLEETLNSRRLELNNVKVENERINAKVLKLTGQLEDLGVGLSKSSKYLKGKKKELQVMRDKLNELGKEKKESDENIVRLKTKIVGLNKKALQFKTNIKNLSETLKKINDMNEKLKDESEKAFRDLGIAKIKHRIGIEKLRDTISNKDIIIKTKEGKIKSIREELEEAKSKLTKREEEYVTVENIEDDVSVIKKKMALANEVITRLNEHIKKINNEKDRLKGELDNNIIQKKEYDKNMETAKVNLEAAQARVLELNKSNAKLEKIKDEFIEEIKEIKARLKEVEESREDEVNKLRSEYEEQLKTKEKEIVNKIEEHKREFAQYKAKQKDAKSREIVKLEKTIRLLLAQKKQVEDELKRIRSDNKKLRESVPPIGESDRMIRGELDELREVIGYIREKAAGKEAKIRSLLELTDFEIGNKYGDPSPGPSNWS